MRDSFGAKEKIFVRARHFLIRSGAARDPFWGLRSIFTARNKPAMVPKLLISAYYDRIRPLGEIPSVPDSFGAKEKIFVRARHFLIRSGPVRDPFWGLRSIFTARNKPAMVPKLLISA